MLQAVKAFTELCHSESYGKLLKLLPSKSQTAVKGWM